jgi:hypothetical protein
MKIDIKRDAIYVLDPTGKVKTEIVTVQQFAEKTGRALSQVDSWLNRIKKNESETQLDHCFPFPHTGGNGPKFIMINSKAERIIDVCKENDLKKEEAVK